MDPRDDRGPSYIVLNVVLGTLGTLVIITRLLVRGCVVKWFGSDDYVMALTGLFNIGFIIAGVEGPRHGLGKHVKDLPPAESNEAIKIMFIQTGFAFACMMLIKTSLALLLIRIGIERAWKWVLITCIGSFVIMTFINMGLLFGRCLPVQSLWNPTIQGTCIIDANAMTVINLTQIAFAVFTDLLLSLAPAIMICKLQMHATTKLLLIALFGLGVLTTICASLKLYHLAGFGDAALRDITYNVISVDIWMVLECEIAIVAACIPALRALFTKTSFFQSAPKDTSDMGYSSKPPTYPSQVESSDIKVVTSVEWASDYDSEKYPRQFSNH